MAAMLLFGLAYIRRFCVAPGGNGSARSLQPEVMQLVTPRVALFAVTLMPQFRDFAHITRFF